MRMNDAFPSKYLKAEDLEEGDLVVTISDVQFEEFKDPKTQRPDNKPVMHFEGKDSKPMVLNKTNYKVISQLLGSDDTDNWIGKKIALYATEVESFGETVLGIRVRMRQKTAQAKATAAPQAARKSAPADPFPESLDQPDADDIPF